MTRETCASSSEGKRGEVLKCSALVIDDGETAKVPRTGAGAGAGAKTNQSKAEMRMGRRKQRQKLNEAHERRMEEDEVFVGRE